MKVMRIGKTDSKEYSKKIKMINSELEIGIKLSLECEYLVKSEKFFMEENNCILIMEYCSCGDLNQLFENKKKLFKNVCFNLCFRYYHFIIFYIIFLI
jgi:serine/threonine protein kinase